MKTSPLPKIVLCIDDSEIMLNMQKTFLESFDYHVITAAGGREGLERALSEPVDGVVIDYEMPDLNGAEVASLLRREKPDLPIIMYSACPAVVQTATDIVDAFVDKALSPGVLVAELKRLLGHPVASVRRFPRYHVYAPIVLRVHRPDGPLVLHGVALEIGEGGLGGVIEGEVNAGESVSIHLVLPYCHTPMQPRAQVRYRNGASHGFEFIGLSATQQTELRRCCQQLARA